MPKAVSFEDESGACNQPSQTSSGMGVHGNPATKGSDKSILDTASKQIVVGGNANHPTTTVKK